MHASVYLFIVYDYGSLFKATFFHPDDPGTWFFWRVLEQFNTESSQLVNVKRRWSPWLVSPVTAQACCFFTHPMTLF